MKIPTWEEAQQSKVAGTATALDTFILDQEPYGIEDETLFRDQLQEAVDYVVATTIEHARIEEHMVALWTTLQPTTEMRSPDWPPAKRDDHGQIK